MTRKRCIIMALALLAACAAVQAQAKPAAGTALDTEVASVELVRRMPVSLKQLKLDIGRLETALGKQLGVKDREQYLQLMVNDILFLQYCERAKIAVSESEINQAVQQMKAQVMAEVQNNPQAMDKSTLTDWASTGTVSDDAFYSVLGKMGVQTVDLKNYVRKRLLLKKYLASQQAAIEAIPRPTYDEVSKYYADHKESLVRPDAVKLAVLYVPTKDKTGDDIRKAKELAESLYSRAKNGPDKFNEVVLRSLESKSGYIGLPEYVYARTDDFKMLFGEAFYEAALSLKQGQVSKLLEGPTGYHILLAIEVYPKKQLELTDPIALGEKGTVYEYLNNAMYTEKANRAVQGMLNTLVQDLRGKAKIKVRPELLAW